MGVPESVARKLQPFDQKIDLRVLRLDVQRVVEMLVCIFFVSILKVKHRLSLSLLVRCR